MVYLIFTAIFFFIGFLFLLCTEKLKTTYSYCFYYFCIVLFWGLSYHYAIDTPGYMDYYNNMVSPITNGIDLHLNKFEPGFNVWAALCKSLKDSYLVFQTLTFAIEMFLIFKGFQKIFHKDYLPLLFPLLFFIYPSILNALRQSFAIAIFIFAIPFIKEKKKWHYGSCIIIASLFHQSAIFLVLFYFIRFIKPLGNTTTFIALFISDLLWLAGEAFSTNIGFVSDILSSGYLSQGERFIKYINEEELESNFGFAKVIEINFVVIAYTLFCKKQKQYDFLSVTLLLYFTLGLMVGGMLTHRILYYFTILYYTCFIIAITTILKNRKVFSYLIIALYMIYFFIFHSAYIKKEYMLTVNESTQDTPQLLKEVLISEISTLKGSFS